MEQINSLLNLPEYATASDRACAVYELMQEHDNIQAARATAESELLALREATSHIFAESICAARGITDAAAQEDIRAAWCQDPYAALNALAGDNITAANPYGCNQYGHEWRAKHGEGWKPRGDRQNDKKKDEEEKKKQESGPPKHKNGAFKIPALDKALAIPTSAPGEKKAPIYKPSYMTDEQFKDALDGMDKDGKKSKNNEGLEELSNKMQKAYNRIEEAQENLENARKKIFDVEDDIQKALKKGDKTKVDELEKERQKANENFKKKRKDVDDAVTKYNEASKKYRQKYKEKSLSDALKKIAPRTDKNGQGLMPFAGNKNKSMSDERAADMANEMFEIALEEGGYEKLYDTPKDKLKAVIAQELQDTPKEDADKLWEDSYDRYNWWRKNVDKVVKKL